VRGHGHGVEDALDLVVSEAMLDQTRAGTLCDELLRARARGHAVRLDAHEPPQPPLGGDRGPDQRVELLRRLAGDRRPLVLGIPGADRDLGAKAALAVAHALRLPSTVVALAAAAAGGQLLGRAAFTALGRHRRRATFAVLAVSAATALASAVAALVS
jgi:hypothetical protein